MGRALVIKPGDRFGKITILREEGKDKHRKRQFLCLCDCGEMRIRLLNTLRRKEK